MLICKNLSFWFIWSRLGNNPYQSASNSSASGMFGFLWFKKSSLQLKVPLKSVKHNFKMTYSKRKGECTSTTSDFTAQLKQWQQEGMGSNITTNHKDTSNKLFPKRKQDKAQEHA